MRLQDIPVGILFEGYIGKALNHFAPPEIKQASRDAAAETIRTTKRNDPESYKRLRTASVKNPSAAVAFAGKIAGRTMAAEAPAARPRPRGDMRDRITVDGQIEKAPPGGWPKERRSRFDDPWKRDY